MANKLHDIHKCYLSPKAEALIHALVKSKMDEDLAFEMVHFLIPEESIYEFPEEGEDNVG